MTKVSIGLRGWRFEEEELFDEAGDFRPLTEMPSETRDRIGRLMAIIDNPCDACWLIHGEEEKQRCRSAAVVYGEPLREVLLCETHEADFLYWFREEGGRDLAGKQAFQNAFHQWFAEGGRAPDGYGGIEHVETEPDVVPEPTPQAELDEDELDSLSEQEKESLDIDLDDLDV